MTGRGTAAAVVLGVVAIGFAITGVLAWRSLAELPAREEIRAALQAGTGVAPPDGSSGARSGPAAEEALVPEPEQRVRFVDEDGVVSIRPQGQLLRAPSAAPEPEPIPPRGPDPDVYRLVIFIDAAIIDARTRTLRLAHVDAPPASRTCRRQDGRAWPCGARARTAIRRLVRRRALECHDIDPEAPPPEEGEAVLVRCAVAGTDLAGWLVEQGWATPSENAPEEWAALHETARAEGRGLYDPTAR